MGGVGVRAYVKSYSGKPHLILKGRAGLRTILTGTKYGIKNPKVMSMGLGKAGATAAAKQGGLLTVVLLTGYRVLDYFLTDSATLSQLVGRLATDIVKVGISTGASVLGATLVGGLTFAIGPIVAVIVVGVATAMLLEYADNKYGITKSVIAGLDAITDDAGYYIARKKQGVLDATGKVVGGVVDNLMDSAKVAAANKLRALLRRRFVPLRRMR